ncbi:MAG: AAA family ATPase [candidate division Zixibacteria bacterium]|nr:AAA family ATPase [candidate division Zixibacteria bacterium]
MAKNVKVAEVDPAGVMGPRPRLVKLVVKNFRCIGATPVTIDLDDIVVLVGPNNVGKSAVLKAYEIIMSEGSNAGHLSIDDFPSGKVDPSALPEIELHTVVYDNSPGPEWIEKTEAGEMLVKELWRWSAPGVPVRRGYNAQEKRWATDEDKEKVPWGAAGVANSRRPQPHRVDAFASPDVQAGEIVKLLMTAIENRVKSHQADSKTNKESDFARLLAGIASLQKRIVAESQAQITAVQTDLSGYIGRVFPGHCVVFDAKPEDDLDKALNLFKSNPQLLMGPENGYLSTIGRQGSGARRTLLWTAIRLLAETGKKKDMSQRPHILLIDEPEICLHPNAIREACDLLYGLPSLTGNWQVMVTTHSPCFVDFARDHTSIVRVARRDDGLITGTTIFRPSKANFDGSDRDLLKLLNLCDPYVAEFFFGGRSIIVEGDTEYTAFMHIIHLFPEKYQGIHVVRARGKATIVSLCKILNQFGAPYSVLHDSDRPTYEKDGKYCANPAWAHNESIRVEMAKASAATRLLATLLNFESAYLGEEVKSNKPYNVLCSLKGDSAVVSRIAALLDALIDFTKPIPPGAVQWTSVDQLRQEVEKI